MTARMPASAELHVAVIDDDKLSAHNLGVKLSFIGERPQIFKRKQWQQEDPAKLFSGYLAIVLGSLSPTEAREQLQALEAAAVQLPIVIASEHDFPDNFRASLSDRLQTQLVAIHKRPVHYEDLVDSLHQARERLGLRGAAFESVIISPSGSALFRSLVGESAAITRLRALLEQLAGKSITVLLSGESGSGKEIVARNLHYLSGRHGAPFVPVNCAAMSDEEFARELFGVAQGYQSGVDARPGLFEKTEGGTLYLDAIDELPNTVQARLLRFLETRECQRLGGTSLRQADVRVIVSTVIDLEQRVQEGGFRQDLFYRINMFPIAVPPLRERREDIPELIRELLARLSHQQREPFTFNSAALASLQQHHWPGNVRELANLVERLSILHPHDVLGISDLPQNYQYAQKEDKQPGLRAAITSPQASGQETATGDSGSFASTDISINLNETLDERTLVAYLQRFERNLLQVALADGAGLVSYAAQRVGLAEAEFRERCKAREVSLH